MRILLIDETYPPDVRGSVPYAPDLVKYVRSQGDEIDVLTVGEDNQTRIEMEQGGCIFRMPRHAELDSARLSVGPLRFLLRRIDSYDILHLNHPNPIGELAFLLCKGLSRGRRVRSVVTFHAEVVSAKKFSRLFNATITHPVLRRLDRIIVSSPNMARTATCLARVRAKVRVVPFGIDMDAWRSRTKLPLPANPNTPVNCSPRLLFVGRLARYKGLPVLLKAMADAPGFLYIAGDGPLRDSLGAQRSALGLTDRVELLGRVGVDLLASLYKWADVLILPSIDRGEAFGYVLIEAMAHETALITTELGTGTSWINVHGETGLVIPPDNPKLLASAIQTVSSHPDVLARFKRNAWRANLPTKSKRIIHPRPDA
ncbi:MAG: glycosyltransferase [Candidatus Marsarchaeota archaeon]|nr:glycosyltransferase [Candidatus Marsarchaeota archaeon]